jgi:hypothetical protein
VALEVAPPISLCPPKRGMTRFLERFRPDGAKRTSACLYAGFAGPAPSGDEARPAGGEEAQPAGGRRRDGRPAGLGESSRSESVNG